MQMLLRLSFLMACVGASLLQNSLSCSLRRSAASKSNAVVESESPAAAKKPSHSASRASPRERSASRASSSPLPALRTHSSARLQAAGCPGSPIRQSPPGPQADAAAVGIQQTVHHENGSQETVHHQNDRLRVTEWIVPPGAKQTVVHTKPTVQWQVLGEDVATPKPEFFPPGREFDIDGGAEGRRQIMFEILQEPRYTEKEVCKLDESRKYQGDVASTSWIDNKYCRVWDFAIDPATDDGPGGDKRDVHHHNLDYCFFVLGKSKLTGFKPRSGVSGSAHKLVGKADVEEFITLEFDGSPERPYVKWWPITNGGFTTPEMDTPDNGLSCHSVENPGSTKFREYYIELK